MFNLFNYIDFMYLIVVYTIINIQQIKKFFLFFNQYYTLFTTIIIVYLLQLTNQYFYIFTHIRENIYHISIFEQFMFRMSVLWTNNNNIYILWWITTIIVLLSYWFVNYKENSLSLKNILSNTKFLYIFFISFYYFIYQYKNSIVYNTLHINSSFY